MVPLSIFGKRVGLLLIVFSLLFGLFTPVTAQAATASATDNLDVQTERWLRFRGIYGCIYETGFNSHISEDAVYTGSYFDNGATAIGYLNPDGKVSCNDDGFVLNSIKTIGFKDGAYGYCAAQPDAARSGGPDNGSSSNIEGCVNGNGTFINNSGDDDGDAREWFAGLKQVVPDWKRFVTADGGQLDESKYYMYYQSLLTFCDAEQSDRYTDDPEQRAEVNTDNKKVVVDVVDGDGKVQSYVYTLGREDTDTVDDIYNNMNGDSDDFDCKFMAKRTTELSGAMSTYVKDYNKAHPDAPREGVSESGSASGSDEAVCSAGALGWIFCPATEMMRDAVDGIAGFLETFLLYEPLLDSNNDQAKAVRAIWGVILVIANVGLIFAFLAVSFSQATSLGISSYGIKRLLPRIIAAAVLINLSFFICAAAVDIANILGVSIKSIIDVGMNIVGENGTGYAKESASDAQWYGTLAIGLTAAAFAIGTGAIVLLLPIVFSALIALFTAFLVLAAREVLITLLIIVSPLAFLAWVLPNTEGWFTKWRKLFTAMLLMFPLIMIIFYGSILVSSLILATHEGGANRHNITDFMVNLLAFGILIVPLFSLPIIMKSAGGIMDRLGVITNNRSRGLLDRNRKWARDKQKNSRFSHAMEFRRENRDVDRAVRRADRKNPYNRAFNAAIRPVGGPQYGAYTQRKATSIEDKEFEQSVADAATGQKNFSGDTLQAMAVTGKYNNRKISEAEQVSAARWLMQNGNFSQRRSLYESIGADSSERLRQTVSSQYFAKGDNAILGAGFGGLMLEGKSQGQPGVLKAAAEQINAGKVTAQALVHDADASQLLNEVASNAASYGVTSVGLESLRRASVEAMSNETTRTKAVAENFSKHIEPMGNLQPSSRPGPANAPASQAPSTTGPSPQQYTSPYSHDDLRSLGQGGIQTIIQQAAGGTSKLSDGDIAKILNATRGQAGFDALNQELSNERDRRRGGSAGSGPRQPLP